MFMIAIVAEKMHFRLNSLNGAETHNIQLINQEDFTIRAHIQEALNL